MIVNVFCHTWVGMIYLKYHIHVYCLVERVRARQRIRINVGVCGREEEAVVKNILSISSANELRVSIGTNLPVHFRARLIILLKYVFDV